MAGVHCTDRWNNALVIACPVEAHQLMHILYLIAPREDIAGGLRMLKLASLWQPDTCRTSLALLHIIVPTTITIVIITIIISIIIIVVIMNNTLLMVF